MIIGRGPSHTCDNTEFEARHESPASDQIELSTFLVNCGQEQSGNSCFCPPPNEIDTGTGNPADFFRNDPFGVAKTCAEENCEREHMLSPPKEPTTDIFYDFVANGQQVYTADRPQLERALQYDLFVILDNLDDEIINENFSAYHTTMQNSNLDKFHQALTQHTDLVDASEQKNLFESMISELNELQLSYDEGILSESEYTASKAQLLSDMEMVKNELNVLHENYTQAKEAEIAYKLDLLSQIQPTNVYDTNMKWIIEKSLTAESEIFLDFEAEEWTKIYDLAIQCPAIGGDAVYSARSLYHLHEWLDFDGLENCNTIEERSENKTSALPFNVLYPNPTAQMIILTWEDNETAQMIITDLQGKLVMTSTIDKGTNSIDLSTLDSGLYIHQIFVETTVQQNGKIVL